MPVHAEQKILDFTPQQVFDLVADVRAYDQFLPWCVASRITREEEGGRVFYADLVIGHKMVRETFSSRVELDPSREIRVQYLSGPLRYLKNRWTFSPVGEGSDRCLVDFYVDFEFRNPIFRHIAGVFFHEAVKRMVHAFEARAHALYDLPGEKP